MNIDFESLHAPQRTLLNTIARATRADSRLRAALGAALVLYVKLRAVVSPSPISNPRAELAARAYLAEVGVGRV